ncbi:thioredoxin family protein [Thomasclavelia ramosa]|uniref:thioredoxin family protein n=1 Tax=Thomasclavelia ramosa TaxID=1547 RepID=UPI0022DF2E6F|nr:thioredoxin family protein [Thomasclavelia ramosa]
MKLFGKKKETSCCCGGNCTPENMTNAEKKKNDKGIKILGSGCAKCKELEKATRSALTELNLDFEIEHITDFAQIASYGVMSTPALVFNGKVISYGKVLTVDEVKKLLEKER